MQTYTFFSYSGVASAIFIHAARRVVATFRPYAVAPEGQARVPASAKPLSAGHGGVSLQERLSGLTKGAVRASRKARSSSSESPFGKPEEALSQSVVLRMM